MRQNYRDDRIVDMSVDNMIMRNNDVLKMRGNGQNHTTRQSQKIVEAIEKDPDLSVANSTILRDKDPDLSMDGDENVDFFHLHSDRGEVSNRESDKVRSHKNEFDHIKVKKRDTPSPPLSEIFVPLTHAYGYGFYLKPLWTHDHTPSVAKSERLQKVRQLIHEGRSRRSRSKLPKSFTKAMSE